MKTCNQGEKAVDEVRGNSSFDLIFLDLEMPPGINGFQTLKELRKLKCNSKIIACTAHESSDVAAECLKSGFDDFLTKPPNRLAISRIFE